MTPCTARSSVRPCIRPSPRAALAVLLAAVALAACAPMATYNPAYVSHPPTAAADKLPGKALVYTVRADDETPFVGPPTSFTGGGTKLTIPLAVIAREIAATVFGDLFRDGAVKANSLDGAAGYRVVLMPKVISYSYEYNQLKNLGFAITPTAIVSLEMTVNDATGKQLLRRRYDSGTVEGPAYMMSGSPGEEIGKVTHKALHDLMLKAAGDVREILRASGAGPVTL